MHWIQYEAQNQTKKNDVRKNMPPMNGESNSNKYTLSRVKQIAGEKLLYNTGKPAWHTVMTQRNKMVWGKGKDAQQGGNICIIIADLGYCMAETNNIVKQFSSN